MATSDEITTHIVKNLDHICILYPTHDGWLREGASVAYPMQSEFFLDEPMHPLFRGAGVFRDSFV
jgi:hypothetical protein